jgi:hypothetical protein
MDPQTLHTIETVEEAVRELLNVCRKKRPLYCRSPKQAAQINRTGRWLLNAIAGLRTSLEPSKSDTSQQAS